jgi:hypothetical protein
MLLPFTHCRICFVVHTIVRCDPAAEDAENSDEAADEEESATGGWQGWRGELYCVATADAQKRWAYSMAQSFLFLLDPDSGILLCRALQSPGKTVLAPLIMETR